MWQSVLSTIALLPVFLYPSALAVIDPYLPTNNADIFDQSAVESDAFNQDAAQGPASTNDALEYQDMLDVQGESENVPVYDLPEHVGQIGGLALDDEEKLVIFHRSGRVWDQYSFGENEKFNKTLGPISNNTIAVVSPKSGKLVGEYGANYFYMPHGLAKGLNGSLFVTDVARHQVIKLDKDFKPVMVLGEKLVPGSDDKHFCKPTDVAVASNGDFFVADGYCNSRIMKFDKDGKLLAKFGHENTEYPGKAGQFWVPHSLTLVEDMNMLCVADRENERIQCFTAGLENRQHPRNVAPTGTFVTKAEGLGRVYAVRYEGHNLFGIVQNEDENGVPDPTQPSVFVMDLHSGRAFTLGQGLVNVHALAVSHADDIYVAQLNPSQIVRISLAPVGVPQPGVEAL